MVRLYLAWTWNILRPEPPRTLWAAPRAAARALPLSRPLNNNLAALLAARQELDAAHSALEMAVRNDPAYATAHENLGDVQAQLAARSYARALKLAPSRQHIALKLEKLRRLLPSTDKPPTDKP